MKKSYFSLQFETGNSAFDDAPASEIARILREIASRVEDQGVGDGNVIDGNGNSVGRFYSRGNAYRVPA